MHYSIIAIMLSIHQLSWINNNLKHRVCLLLYEFMLLPIILLGSLSHQLNIIVATMSIITVLLVVVASLQAIEIQAQNNGDIRLVNKWRNNLSTFREQLEVFIDGKWGTVCGKSGTDLQAVADTACRQLGLKLLLGAYGTVTQLGYPVAPDSMPIHFGSIDCSSSNSLNGVCSTDYYQHVLRCAVDTKVDATACTHSHDIGASCSTERITSNPYKSSCPL